MNIKIDKKKDLLNKWNMYSVLCDRCLTCAHTVLQKYEIEKDIKHIGEFKQHLKYMLDIISKIGYENNIYADIQRLQFDFLNTNCDDCVGINIKKDARYGIEMYCKEFVVDKLFATLCENQNAQYFEEFITNKDFIHKVQLKLITFNINKRGNKATLNYYHQKFISYHDLSESPYFEIFNKLSIYYKHIFGVPIYLANIPKEEYLKRQKMNLEELLPKHRLCLIN